MKDNNVNILYRVNLKSESYNHNTYKKTEEMSFYIDLNNVPEDLSEYGLKTYLNRKINEHFHNNVELETTTVAMQDVFIREVRKHQQVKREILIFGDYSVHFSKDELQKLLDLYKSTCDFMEKYDCDLTDAAFKSIGVVYYQGMELDPILYITKKGVVYNCQHIPISGESLLITLKDLLALRDEQE